MYEGSSFNYGTNAPPYQMAVKKLVEIAINFKGGGGVVSNNGTKFCLNLFVLSKVIESSNMRSRNTLVKIVKPQASFEIRGYIKDCINLDISGSHTYNELCQMQKNPQFLGFFRGVGGPWIRPCILPYIVKTIVYIIAILWNFSWYDQYFSQE